jgi:RNA polymerase sigma-70 factor (ECF subfamily)
MDDQQWLAERFEQHRRRLQAVACSQSGLHIVPALINGTPGIISSRDGQPFSVIGFTVTGGKITEIDILMDPDRLRQLDLSALDDQRH